MYLFANSPTVDMIALQTYITAVGRCFLWRIRTPYAFVRRQSIPTQHRMVTLSVSDFTPKCIGVFVVYLNITERSSQLRVLLESYLRTKWWEPLFALLWLGNFKTSGCFVGRPTCAPTTTRLTPQLVGTSAIAYNLRPYTNMIFLKINRSGDKLKSWAVVSHVRLRAVVLKRGEALRNFQVGASPYMLYNLESFLTGMCAF